MLSPLANRKIRAISHNFNTRSSYALAYYNLFLDKNRRISAAKTLIFRSRDVKHDNLSGNLQLKLLFSSLFSCRCYLCLFERKLVLVVGKSRINFELPLKCISIVVIVIGCLHSFHLFMISSLADSKIQCYNK